MKFLKKHSERQKCIHNGYDDFSVNVEPEVAIEIPNVTNMSVHDYLYKANTHSLFYRVQLVRKF